MKWSVAALLGLGSLVPVVPAQEAKPWEQAKSFWSFQPVRDVAPPPVHDTGWARTPIDRFILAKLEEKGLKPVAFADRHVLIRRATFDLTGLPPTVEEINRFIKDSEADPRSAYERLVDRLLASPAYGEKQARQWLDVARYAEDQAHTFGVKPNTSAWRYRDWVIDAFNDDMPYDQFIKRQIAADLLEGDEIRHRAALGFFGLGAQYYKSSNPAKAIAEELDDKLDTLTRGFLGLTIACARCHDHKFDPIPTADYYSLAGVFASSRISEVALASQMELDRYAEAKKKFEAAEKLTKDVVQGERDKLIAAKADDLARYFLAAWKLEAHRLKNPQTTPAQVAKQENLDPNALDRMNKFLNRKSQNIAVLDAWFKNLPKTPTAVDPPADVQRAAMALRDFVKAAVGPMKDKAKTEMVASLFGDKGVLPILDAEVVSSMSDDCRKTYDRLKAEQDAVAKAMPPAPATAHGLSEAPAIDMKIAIRGNPLKPGEVVPRRFLQAVAGQNPPRYTKGSGRLELAEAIAAKDNPLTARVMANRVWQQHFGQGIVGTPSNFGQLGDRPTHPELLDFLATELVKSGWSIKKLHRRIMLSSVYQLASETPSEKVRTIDAENRLLSRASRQRLQVEEFRDALLSVAGRLNPERGGPTTNLDDANNTRRAIYGKVSRHELSGLLRIFDFPDANITSDRRTETTVPQQQLFVLNSEFMIKQAKAFADRLQKSAPDDAARVKLAYLLAFARPASDDEIRLGQAFLAGRDASGATAKLTRWERYAQALLASNEFLYVD
jgi:cytochrome c553